MSCKTTIGDRVVIEPGIWILSLRFWMYKVSEAVSSGGGVVSGAVGEAGTGCWSGCGIGADMMEVAAPN